MNETTIGEFNTSNTFSSDVSCTQCGYNLRGLTPQGRCPECNTPIARSLHGQLLQFADPEWLDRVRLGAKLMLVGMLVGVVVGGLAGFFNRTGSPPVFAQLATVASLALGFAAVLLVTTQEPAAVLAGTDLAVRKIVRVCAALSLVGSVIPQVSTPTGLLALLTGLLALAGAVNHFCFCLLLRGFSDRIPNRDLSGQITTVMWGYGICTAVAAILGVIAVFMIAGGTNPATAFSTGPTPLLLIPACVLGFGLMVFGIWYLIILIRIHRALKVAVGLARQTLVDPNSHAMVEPAVVGAASGPPTPQEPGE